MVHLVGSCYTVPLSVCLTVFCLSLFVVTTVYKCMCVCVSVYLFIYLVSSYLAVYLSL
jgi:hypothetical protein